MILACFEYDEQAQILRTQPLGRLTDRLIIKYAAALVEAPAVTPGLCELVDLSGIEAVEITERSLRILAQTCRSQVQKFRNHRTAIAAPTDLLYGLSRMYQMISLSIDSPVTIRVFRTVEEAIAWLG